MNNMDKTTAVIAQSLSGEPVSFSTKLAPRYENFGNDGSRLYLYVH